MKERRTIDIDLKKEENDESMVLEGYAVVFESPATYYGETEIIDSNAFRDCDMNDVVLRYNHNDTNYTLARTRNKSLQLLIDEKGLYFRAELIPTTSNKDAYLMVKSGLVDKCSFAFADYDFTYDPTLKTTRINSIRKLFDVSIVDFPYYEETSVEARGLENTDGIAKQVREIKRKALYNRLEREELLSRLNG